VKLEFLSELQGFVEPSFARYLSCSCDKASERGREREGVSVSSEWVVSVRVTNLHLCM